MATFSKKMMGKEVGSASVYAQPHTMSGKKVSINSAPTSRPALEGVKTSGIKMRGTGAATKGVMARGPMG